MKYSISILCSLFLFVACGPQYDLAREDLLGDWRTTDMFINGDDSEIPFSTEGLVIMGFQDENYYYNFNGGDWQVEADKITLNQGEETFREYTVLYFNGDSLVVEANVTEAELFFDIESVAQDEIVTLTEHFKKQ